MDIELAISGISGIAPIGGIEGAWKWTGGRRFTFAIALDSTGLGMFQTNSIDFYDEGLVKHLFNFARSRGVAVAGVVNPQTVLEGFVDPGYSFDVAALVPPAIHRYTTTQNEELASVTAGLFPAYRCEFSGVETPVEARERFSRMLRVANLRRDPSPAMKMSFDNPRTGVRSTNRGRGYADFRVLENELTMLYGAPEAHVEMENFEQHVWRIHWDEDWLVKGFDELTLSAREEVIDWARSVVYTGVHRDA